MGSTTSPTPAPTAPRRAVFFFDIDNCLYPRSKKVHHMMGVLIDAYFRKHLALTAADATHLHLKYYKEYGLAIEGLVRHHKVDPLEYNTLVDDALPLDEVLHDDPRLRALLQSFDREKVKLWLFTNAYVTHGERVTKLLGVEGCFEGMTFCDYAEAARQVNGDGTTGGGKLLCKPHPEMFERAEQQAGVQEGDEIFFIDDSVQNCRAAEKRGWNVVHKIEPEDADPEDRAARWTIRDHEELRALFPKLFKDGERNENGKI